MNSNSESDIDIDKILNYYDNVDKQYIDNLCKDTNLKNLIKLSTLTDLYIFDKNKKTWAIKKPEKIIKECEKYKTKEIKTTSMALSNLAKLNNLTNLSVKTINTNLENKIDKLDEMINCVKNIKKEKDNYEDKYLAFYSN
jgi:hypothetical protein